MRQYLCKTDEVPNNGVLQVEIDDREPVAVFNLDGTFHVTDDTCTHAEASLSEGEIEDGIIECPFHAGCFNIATGQAVEPPATVPLRTYPVTIENDAVYADIED
jgi:nitrite reductase/ring-hydroxylating ferredoxin subunit